ncbi:glycoside hydrolase family 73 protein [Marinilactibacillus psychrotolerans]|uniref:N-acetylmuramidase n=1 Tax=Marinilactibacillus psychrotolerans TaxID=191770 RepID=A0A5R9C360_9LACT|nr:glycoside hydrolase family 73 protein [Marinilactibacillus psychrotolerans]TLQ07211.1 N-acetylmuramidase [Marinilactibacillus psychrotolerans]GEQ34447.1 N-acetylmuramidase [Marinilactibacillus psychrotolerans]
MAKKMVKKRKSPRKKKQSPIILGMKIFFVCILLFIFSIALISKKLFEEPSGISTNYEQEFIHELAENAVIIEAKYHVRPSVMMAQAILESNWGKSELAQREKNYYGIKGENPSSYTTKEFEEDEWIEISAQFRSYDSLLESMEDYAKLLNNGTEWDGELYKEVIEAPNYIESAEALQTAGYATDPDYPEKVISLIETYELYKYDHDTIEQESKSE